MANKEELNLQKELKKLLDASNLSASERLAIQADAARNTKQQLKDTIAILRQEQKVTKELKAQEAINQKIADLESKQIDIVKTLQSDLVKNKKAFEGIGKSADYLAIDLAKSLKQQVAIGKITAKQAAEMADLARETADLANNLETIAGNDALAATFQDAQDLASETAKKIGGIFGSIPGGNALFKALGGDDLEAQLKKGVTDGMAKMAQSMAEGKGMVASLKDGMGAFANVVKGIPNIGMILGIGAAIVLAKALFSVFKQVSHEAHELSEAAGITYTEAKKLNKEARKAQTSFGNQLATMEDITAVQKELVKGMGSAALVSTEVAANVADTAKAFGISAETAGKVTAELTQMGMSQQAAADLQLETNAAALKAGVNVAAVNEDIAKSAKSSAAYFGGSGKELAKAAIEAAKLGTSIEQMTKTAEGLLDIEDSLQKQFRAQSLTGKSLNFDKARQLALDGKIVEAQQEMLKQAGTIDEFNAMAPYQKKALAEAMGMEVGELQKSLALQKHRSSLTDDELAAANGLNLSAEQLAKMDADQIKAELAKKNASDKTAAAFQKLKNDLISALAPAAEAFAGIFSALSPVITVIGKVLKVAFYPITLAGQALQFLLKKAEKYKGIVIAIGALLASNYIQSKGITAEKVKQFAQTKAQAVKEGAMNLLRKIGLGSEEGITAAKTKGLIKSGLEFIKQTAINALKTAKLGIQLAYNTAIGVGNALMNTGIGGILKQAGALVMKAVGGIWSVLSMLGPIAGPIAAIAATGTLFALFNKAKAEKAGDVAINPKGGPIVASPKEGKVFQGTNNDGVSMSPSSGQPGVTDNSTTAQISSNQMNQIIEALNSVVSAVQNPPPVVVGESQVGQIGSKISAAKSFLS